MLYTVSIRLLVYSVSLLDVLRQTSKGVLLLMFRLDYVIHQ